MTSNLKGYRVWAKVDGKDVSDIVLLGDRQHDPTIAFCKKIWNLKSDHFYYCDWNRDPKHNEVMSLGGRHDFPTIEFLHIEKAFTPEFDKYFKGIEWQWLQVWDYYKAKKQLPILLAHDHTSVEIIYDKGRLLRLVRDMRKWNSNYRCRYSWAKLTSDNINIMRQYMIDNKRFIPKWEIEQLDNIQFAHQ